MCPQKLYGRCKVNCVKLINLAIAYQYIWHCKLIQFLGSLLFSSSDNIYDTKNGQVDDVLCDQFGSFVQFHKAGMPNLEIDCGFV